MHIVLYLEHLLINIHCFLYKLSLISLKALLLNLFYRECELPEEVIKVVKKELKRLKQMPQHSPEYPMLRNYLELVSELPWNESAVEVIDIQKAKEACHINLHLFSNTMCTAICLHIKICHQFLRLHDKMESHFHRIILTYRIWMLTTMQ